MAEIQNFVLKKFHLWKSLSILADYFTMINRINADRRSYFRWRLMSANMIYQSFNCVLLCCVPMSEWMRSLLVDMAFWFNLPQSVNLVIFQFILTFHINLQILFYHNRNVVTNIVEKVVIKQNSQFFPSIYFNGHLVVNLIRKWAFFLLFTHQSFYVAIGMLDLLRYIWRRFFAHFSGILTVTITITLHYNLYVNLSNNCNYSLRCFTLSLVGMLSIFSFSYLCITVIQICCLMSLLIVSTAAVLLIKLKQLAAGLYFECQNGQVPKFDTSRRLRCFTKDYTITMSQIFIANRIFGKIILFVLVANWPINIIFLINTAFGDVSTEIRFFLAMVVFQQFIYLFGNHYLATMFCRTIHHPSKRLLKLDVLIKSLNTRDHLKLCHYTQMLHTNNQYGITYGNIMGLITVSKFLKVCSVSTL